MKWFALSFMGGMSGLFLLGVGLLNLSSGCNGRRLSPPTGLEIFMASAGPLQATTGAVMLALSLTLLGIATGPNRSELP